MDPESRGSVSLLWVQLLPHFRLLCYRKPGVLGGSRYQYVYIGSETRTPCTNTFSNMRLSSSVFHAALRVSGSLLSYFRGIFWRIEVYNILSLTANRVGKVMKYTSWDDINSNVKDFPTPSIMNTAISFVNCIIPVWASYESVGGIALW